MSLCVLFVFFFKQKTAYEMRISDWSSDVCSSDLNSVAGVVRALTGLRKLREDAAEEGVELPPFKLVVGARMVLEDGTPDIIAYPATRHGWDRLTRLLTIGNRRTVQGVGVMTVEHRLIHCEDMVLIAISEEHPSELQS